MRTLALVACVAVSPVAVAQTLSHGRFENVSVQRPAQVRSVALFLAGAQSDANVQLEQALLRQGALVVRIDTSRFLRQLERDGAECVYPAGDLENLSRFVQAYLQIDYRPPVLVGSGAGAGLTYAAIAQAPQGSIAGALSLGFCADVPIAKRLCSASDAPAGPTSSVKLSRATLHAPWTAVQSTRDRTCSSALAQRFASGAGTAVQTVDVDPAFAKLNAIVPTIGTAYATLAGRSQPVLPPTPKELSDLPLIEVPAKGAGEVFAVLLSGDGGWAGIDKDIGAALAKHGVPVVGLDSLRYFWKARTPETTAADLDRLIRFYLVHWRKNAVVLIGYSQGADVLPFALNRLPAATLARVRLAALLGLGQRAQFEFHLTNWLSSASDGLPIAPELARIAAPRLLCIYGSDEPDSLCPQLAKTKHRVVTLPGGHHFDGDYERLNQIILDELAR